MNGETVGNEVEETSTAYLFDLEFSYLNFDDMPVGSKFRTFVDAQLVSDTDNPDASHSTNAVGGRPTFQTILAVHGYGFDNKLGNLSEIKMAVFVNTLSREVKAENEKLEKRLKKVLTDRQWTRLKQIYLQFILLSSDHQQRIGYDALEMGIDYHDDERGQRLLEMLRKANEKIAEQVRVLQFIAYADGFEEILGTTEAIGDAFYVKVPKEKRRSLRSRRQRLREEPR